MLLATILTAVIAQAAAPVAVTGPAGSVTSGGAVVAGTVDPQGSPTTYQVEYGTSASYGVQTAAQDAGTGDDPVAISVPLTGLTAATTYHYRVVAAVRPVSGTLIATGSSPVPASCAAVCTP